MLLLQREGEGRGREGRVEGISITECIVHIIILTYGYMC